MATPPVSSIEDALRLVPAVLWESDAVDWRALYVSDTLRDVTGYDPADWLRIREFWEDRVHPDDRVAIFRVVDEAVRLGRSAPYEYRWRVADGTFRWFRDQLVVRRHPDGTDRMCGVMLDVTELHAAHDAQAAVSADRDRLASSMEQSGEIVVVTDGTGTVTYANAAFERTLGVPRDEAVGRPIRDFIVSGTGRPADAEAAIREAWTEMLAGRPWTGELRVRAADGRVVHLLSSVVPVRDADGSVTTTMGFHRDVTHVRELEAQLAQAAKLEAIGQLAGGVAHDFNNILTAILGYVRFIAEAVPGDSPILEDLHQITAAGERAQRLTAQLLAFGRRTVLRPAVVDIGTLLRELMPMLERLIGEDIRLGLHVPDDPAVAFVDPGQLQQAVLNLVVNARNAMPAGGEIRVSAEVRPGDIDRIPAGDWVVVEVADTGTGIPPDVLARIFEPFFTTDEFGRGTGLGLAVVDGFVRQSAGHVRVATAPGEGSTFELWLPVHVARETAPEAAPRPVAARRPTQRPLTVLVAEDEAVVRAIVRRTLSMAGHRVLLASSGQEALEVAGRFDGPIDVLLSDVVMPGIRGPQLAAELRRTRPGIRVVLASGYTEDEVTRRGILLGAEAFLAKPYTVELLLEAVEGSSGDATAGDTSPEDASPG